MTVHTIHQERLSGASDAHVWAAAQNEVRFLITTDLDFSDVRKYVPGTHQGILLLRLAKEGKNTITALIEWFLEHYDIEIWKSAIVVASGHTLRIRCASKIHKLATS
jgi:predicted nuclease of predicted toxin-antitoxin system